jgi:hypothetical protein
MPRLRQPADLARAIAEKRQAQKVERLYIRYIRDMPKKPPAPSIKVRLRNTEKRAWTPTP